MKEQTDGRQRKARIRAKNQSVLKYLEQALLWRPAGMLVSFVVVVHPHKGRMILMSTDLSLSAKEIIQLYGLRFKIEVSFKQAIHKIGTYTYHFWMKAMKPTKHRAKKTYLHRDAEDYRDRVRRKIDAYHRFAKTHSK